MRGAIRQFVNWWRDAGISGHTAVAESIPVLAIMPDDSDKQLLSTFSARGQWDLLLTSTCDQALDILRRRRAAVVLCDRDLPGSDWRENLAKLAFFRPDCSIILTSSVNDAYLWDEVIHSGGYDVLAKPLREEQTVRAVNLAWSYLKNRRFSLT